MTIKNKNNTRQKILIAGTVLANEDGFATLTIEEVADEAGVVPGTIHHHFKHAIGFKDALVKHAVAKRELKIIAQAIATNHRFVKHIPASLREQAIDSLR